MTLNRRKGHPTLFGEIIRSFYSFLNEGDRSPMYELYSPVDDKVIPAQDFVGLYMVKGSAVFAVKPNKLPLTSDIYGVVSVGDRVRIETPRLSASDLERVLRDNLSPAEVHGRSIDLNHSRIITTYSKNVGRLPKSDQRTSYKIIPDYKTEAWEIAMDVLDYLFNESCFDRENEEQSTSPARALEPKIEMRQEMRMSQLQIMKLRLKQFPALSLSMRQMPHQNAYHGAIAPVVRMNAGALRAHLENQARRNPAIKMSSN